MYNFQLYCISSRIQQALPYIWCKQLQLIVLHKVTDHISLPVYFKVTYLQ